MASGLSDGSSAPAYNLRTLARSIQYVSHAASIHGMQRALFDGFSMCFASMLEADSAAAVLELLKQHILHNKAEPSLPSVIRSLPKALSQRSERFVNVEVLPSPRLCHVLALLFFPSCFVPLLATV
jgi:midasin (ATPase involved in ribosome maturation)